MTSKQSILYAGVIMAALLGASAQAQAQDACSYRAPDLVKTKWGEDRAYYKHWLGACRDTGYCSANIYLAGGGNPIAYHIRIGRQHYGLDYELKFVMADNMLAGHSDLRLSVDGKELAILKSGADDGWYLEGNVVNEYVVGQVRANLDIIPALKAGNQLTAIWTNQSGQQISRQYSLLGLTNTLCWMDRKQKP